VSGSIHLHAYSCLIGVVLVRRYLRNAPGEYEDEEEEDDDDDEEEEEEDEDGSVDAAAAAAVDDAAAAAVGVDAAVAVSSDLAVVLHDVGRGLLFHPAGSCPPSPRPPTACPRPR